jgi:hypothetical protein
MAAPSVAALERPPAQPLPDPNALVRSMLARDRQTSGFATAVLRKLSVEIAKVPAAKTPAADETAAAIAARLVV